MRFACRKFSKTGAPRFFVPTFALTLQLANKLSRNDERPWSSVRLLRPSTSPHPTPSSSTSWWSQQETPSSSSANSPGFFSSLRRHPQKPGSPGFTNTQHLPLSAFLTPSGIYFSCDLAALFRAAAARGIFAFRAFPSRMASDRLRSRSPHGVTRPCRHSTSTRRTEPRSNTVPLAPLAVDDSTIRRASLATVRVASWVYHSRVRICRRGV